MGNKKDVELAAAAAGAKDISDASSVPLDAQAFGREASAVLAQIEQGISDAEIDAEADFVSAGVLEIEFEGGGKMVINRHEVSREIWVAARTGAHHFRWDGAGWVDTRSGEALMAVVSGLVSQMAGRPVVLG